jgi:repressor LexA
VVRARPQLSRDPLGRAAKVSAMQVRVIQPGERVAVQLSPVQRDLILEHAFIDPELAQRLRVAEAEGASIIARLTLDDIDELLGAVAAEANHAKDARLAKGLNTIYERLRDVEEAHTNDPSAARLAPVFPVPKYTPKEGQYLAFIHYYSKIHGEAPSEADLQRYFKVSPSTVHQMVLALEDRGFIERSPGRSRSIRLLIARSELPDLE